MKMKKRKKNVKSYLNGIYLTQFQARHAIRLRSWILLRVSRGLVLRAPALPAGLPAHLGQQVHPVGAKILVQELVDVRVAGVANRVAAVARDLAKAVEVQLPDEARDIVRLEDRPARVQILRLESLVIEQYGAAVRAPPDRPGRALVHYPPELLRESHRLQHAILVHPRARPGWGSESTASRVNGKQFRTSPVPRPCSCVVAGAGTTFETNDRRITATIIKAIFPPPEEMDASSPPLLPADNRSVLPVQIRDSSSPQYRAPSSIYIFFNFTFLHHFVLSVPIYSTFVAIYSTFIAVGSC